jgi:flavin reductase (DIM6/NTAB) family NADH-FMN oxidoreductase RutF
MKLLNPGLDLRAYRSALGAYPTGVTVITTVAQGRIAAIVANSFTSVSLEPPLLLWCIARQSGRHGHFCEAERFTISVLTDDQRDICRSLARPGGGEPPTQHLIAMASGPPAVAGALAAFECETWSVAEHGDHSLIVGKVVHYHANPVQTPLIFCGGGFASLASMTSD